MNTSGEEGGGLSPFLTTASSHEQCEGKRIKVIVISHMMTVGCGVVWWDVVSQRVFKRLTLR